MIKQIQKLLRQFMKSPKSKQNMNTYFFKVIILILKIIFLIVVLLIIIALKF